MSWWWLLAALLFLIAASVGGAALAIFMASRVRHEPSSDAPIKRGGS